MSQTLLQSAMWIATFAVPVLFLQRRRKRRSNF
jgi:hypothetical protein